MFSRTGKPIVGQKEVTVHRCVNDQPEESPRDSPPCINLLESNYCLTQVAGTTTLAVGVIAKVGMDPTGHLVNFGPSAVGISAGCGHYVYQIDAIVTEHGYHRGLGGRCSYCTKEAALKLEQNAISFQQAEAMSIYCSSCSGHCDGCGHDFCARHVRPSREPDGTVFLLCPDCMEKAKRDRRRSFWIALALRPFRGLFR